MKKDVSSSDSDDSASSNHESSSEEEANFTYGIYLHSTLIFSKQKSEFISNVKKNECKIIKFGSEWKIFEIIRQIKKLSHNDFPNLLIAIVELSDIGLMNQRNVSKSNKKVKTNGQKLKSALRKFCKVRPMILHIEFQNESSSKFFYKCLNNCKFQEITKKYANSDVFTNFPSFLWMVFVKKYKKFTENVNNSLKTDHESSEIFDFFTTLKNRCKKEIVNYIITGYAYNRNLNHILAIIDSRFYDENDEINSKIIDHFESKIEQINPSIPEDSGLNNNEKVREFIVKICTKMIGLFEYSFQLNISTIAFEKNQLDFLCDLVDICDFPFPKNLEITSIAHDRLKQIIDKRIKFNEAINECDEQEIKTFTDSHPNHIFIYNPRNFSALHQAFSAKKTQLFEHLEMLGLKTPEYLDYCKVTNDEESKNMAKQLAIEMRNDNVNRAFPISNKTNLLLLSKSFIHNKNIIERTKIQYRNKIAAWIENIYKIEENEPHLDTIAQCDQLKIIFDFDSEEVNNIDPFIKGAEGVLYPSFKWIFIGAKYLDEDENPDKIRESCIEGVIAHETDHYGLVLTYENGGKPYFKDDTERQKMYEEVIEEINKWKSVEINGPDDDCDGIISSVFKLYPANSYHAELIVRVPHILTRYAGDNEKLAILENKNKPLFDFYRNFILEDLKKFNLKERQDVREFNIFFGKMAEIEKCTYKFSKMKDINHLLANHTTIVSTYIPKLLLLNIHKNLIFKYNNNNIVNAKCIFIDSENLKNSNIMKKLQDILKKPSELIVVIDCTKGYVESFEKLILNQEIKFTFIMPDDQSSENLTKSIKNSKIEKVSYTWDDLSLKTQEELLETKANLLKDPVEIRKLLPFENESSEPIVELFKMLVEKSEININESPAEDEEDENNFNAHFQERAFNKHETISEHSKYNARNDKQIMEPKIKIIETKMILAELLKDVANKGIILIADQAGTGKSWTTKFLAKIMRKQNPRKWTTRVDLKQFIEHFKTVSESVISFSKFIIESILKLKTNIEKELFIKMYSIGRFNIFFDGFDEIAPNYYDFVLNLVKSFKFNDGNQLWIATRDNFEIDLMKELNIDVVYKLEQFTHDDGINLMTSILIFYNLESKNELKSEINIQNHIKKHSDYQAYKKKATDLNEIIRDLNITAIGAPQFYQMVAKIFINKGAELSAMTVFEIFDEYVGIQYVRWASQKGQIRHKMSVLSQRFDMNYIKLHEFYAMKGSYPDKDNFCDLELNSKEWPELEIIACGLLVLRSGELQFHHETFREFFIALFITRILKKKKQCATEEFCKYLYEVLTLPKFEVVRVFLNGCLAENQPHMQQIITKIASTNNKWVFLLDIYKNNLKNLQKMWVNFFKSLDYDEMKNILFSDRETIFKIAENKDLCKKFQAFPHGLLKPQDLHEMILLKNEHGDNFVHLAVAFSEFDAIKFLFENHKQILGEEYFEEILYSKGRFERNLLQTAAIFSQDIKTFEYIWSLFQNLMNSNEKFLAFLKTVDIQENNIFNLGACFTTSENFECLTKLSNKITSRPKIKELLSNIGSFKRNMLHAAANQNKSSELHKILWAIMREYFDSDEIFELITHTDKDGNNLLQNAVLGDDLQIIELTMNEITTTLNSCNRIQNKSSESEVIPKTKEKYWQSLLQLAASGSNNIQSFDCLWSIIQSLLKSDDKPLAQKVPKYSPIENMK